MEIPSSNSTLQYHIFLSMYHILLMWYLLLDIASGAAMLGKSPEEDDLFASMKKPVVS